MAKPPFAATATMNVFLQVMGARSRYTDEFLEFLKQLPGNTRVTFDQWCSFLEFSWTVPEGFAGYDEDGACEFDAASACLVQLSPVAPLLFSS